jgi:hypothetical protein
MFVDWDPAEYETLSRLGEEIGHGAPLGLSISAAEKTEHAMESLHPRQVGDPSMMTV